MKQILIKEDVRKAIDDLRAKKQKTSLGAIHAALGHRGSMTTLRRLKAEIDAEAAPAPAKDSVKGLEAFRQVWALAVEEGRQQQHDAILELEENIASFSAENERLDGTAMASENRAEEAEQAKAKMEMELGIAKDRLHGELEQMHKALENTAAELAATLKKLADVQAIHAQETTDLQTKLSAAIRQAHEFEMQAVRQEARLPQAGEAGRKP